MVSNPARDYEHLIKLLESDARDGHVYQELMKLEERTLKNARRVANQRASEKLKQELDEFLRLDIRQIALRFAATWYEIFRDAVEGKFSFFGLLVGDRKIYVGLTVVFIALILIVARM